MATDIKKGLPVRTENDADHYVRVKIFDAVSGVNAGTVDTDNNLHVEMHGNDPAGDDRVVRTSELGALTPDGFYHVSNNTIPGNIGLIAHARNATPGLAQQIFRPTGVQGTALNTVHALDMSMHDENGDAYSQTNPLPVIPVSESEIGDEICDFDDADSVAASGSANHDYVVTDGKVFILKQLLHASSGRHKIELQIGDGAASEGFTTKIVTFQSEDNDPDPITLAQPIIVTGTVDGATIRIIKTNRDNSQAQSLYSTILGLLRDA